MTMRDIGPRLALLETRRLRVPSKQAEPFYVSQAWRSLVRRLIAERGRQCQDPQCKTADRGARQTIYGDHIVEIKDGGPPLDPGNILLRCARCHGRKTVDERRQRGEKSIARQR